MAKRFQVMFSSEAFSPETIHTSPLTEQIAALVESLKKSKPLKRSQELKGLSSGAVMVSTTYGPSPPLVASLPWVTSGAPQRVGPPWVKAARFGMGASRCDGRVPGFSVDDHRCSRNGFLAATPSSFSTRRPSRPASQTGASSPTTVASHHFLVTDDWMPAVAPLKKDPGTAPEGSLKTSRDWGPLALSNWIVRVKTGPPALFSKEGSSSTPTPPTV